MLASCVGVKWPCHDPLTSSADTILFPSPCLSITLRFPNPGGRPLMTSHTPAQAVRTQALFLPQHPPVSGLGSAGSRISASQGARPALWHPPRSAPYHGTTHQARRVGAELQWDFPKSPIITTSYPPYPLGGVLTLGTCDSYSLGQPQGPALASDLSPKRTIFLF